MTTAAIASILPPNATPFERAVEASTARAGDVPVPIPGLVLPEECPAAALPWLAWAEDVPVWNRDWPEAMKRGICASSRRIHRLQGTLAGLKNLAEWAGGRVIKAVTPPAKKFLAPALNTDARNALVALLPQLRISPRRVPGIRAARSVFFRRDYLGHCWPHTSGAVSRSAPSASIEHNGSHHEPCAVTMAGRVATVARYGHAGFSAVIGRFPRWPLKSSAADRVYHLDLAVAYDDGPQALRRQAVSPSATVSAARPDRLPLRGVARGMFLGRPLHGCTQPITADGRLLDRLYVLDPVFAAMAKSAAFFIGGYLGQPPHTAILQVAIRGRRATRAVTRFVGGCLAPMDTTKLDTVRAALSWGKRASDKLLMDTVTLRPIKAGAVVLAGRALAGALAPA